MRTKQAFFRYGMMAATALATAALWADTPARSAAELFRVQREAVFEFAQKPSATRRGDEVTIVFETKGWCDVTVAIEDEDGRILRHLASGLLGANAPEPFEKNAKQQTVVWDGKDDAGAYVDDKERVRVRVSLGLKPQFERTLFWHPGKPAAQRRYRAYAGQRLLFAPAKDGMYVFDSGHGIDHVRLFDRDGNYVRTAYPFPAARMNAIPDLIRHRFPDGPEIPIKPNWLQTTLLMSGTNCETPTYRDGRYSGHQSKGHAYAGMNGAAGDILVASDTGRLALIGARLARLSADGGAGGRRLHGPAVYWSSPDGPVWTPHRGHRDEDELNRIRPKRAAFSPDGEWLYLSMYMEAFPGHRGTTLWRHRVKRMRFDSDDPPEVFAGAEKAGKEPGQFDMPAGIACDDQGRVYVADHRNDRIQVFDADGNHQGTMPVERPATLDISAETGEIYVFSKGLPYPGPASYRGQCRLTVPHGTYDEVSRHFRLIRLAPFDQGGQELDRWDLHQVAGLRGTMTNMEHALAVDTGSDPVRLWLAAPSPPDARSRDGRGILVLQLEDGEWTVQRDLLQEAKRAVVRTAPAPYNRQRLYVDPAEGMLYLGEGDSAEGKAFRQVVRIDPDSGRMRAVELPLSVEDMAFDRDGHAYLRTQGMIMRYETGSWREVPFDYGEERQRTGYGSGSGTRSVRVVSGAVFPGNRGWHHGGMHVDALGRIAVTSLYSVELEAATAAVHTGEEYRPAMYPGRRYNPGGRFGGALVHVLDRHGRLLHSDALPGLHANVHGTAIDLAGDLYLLNASPAVIDGERHFNDHAATLMKFSPGEARLLAARGAPVPLQQPPDRPADLYQPTAWVENAHWMQPGIGWASNYSTACACWNTRFTLDYFARSFGPEVDRYSVAVLDSAGNLILRIGQYGNVDDGMPLAGHDPRSPDGPPNPRSIGGDEVALKHAPYVATHTDRRLFIADSGNARIASVKLGYHADETIALKDVPDEGR